MKKEKNEIIKFGAAGYLWDDENEKLESNEINFISTFLFGDETNWEELKDPELDGEDLVDPHGRKFHLSADKKRELDAIAAEGRERPISGKAEMELQDGRNKFNKYMESGCYRKTGTVTVETNDESCCCMKCCHPMSR